MEKSKNSSASGGREGWLVLFRMLHLSPHLLNIQLMSKQGSEAEKPFFVYNCVIHMV